MFKFLKYTFLVIILTFNASCEEEDIKENQNQNVTLFDNKGILGQYITIEGQNFEQGKVRVLFDQIVAEIQYSSPQLVFAKVPRNLERYNPTLKVVNLDDNTELLNSNFQLETPEIYSFSESSITFNEELIIHGNFFDEDIDYVTVKINGKEANIVETSLDHIIVIIPTDIDSSDLQVSIKAQLQQVESNLNLTLKAPQITAYEDDEGAEITGLYSFLVNGVNFNPDPEYGEVYINGIQSEFLSSNNQLQIVLPFGPYQDLKIDQVEYKTAGYTTSIDQDLPITNKTIMVSHTDEIPIHSSFTHNAEVYKFFRDDNMGTDNTYNYILKTFDATTQNWIEPSSSFTYQGLLADAVYDGNQNLYLYKQEPNTYNFELTKLDLNTNVEQVIPMPFGNNVITPIFFAYQNKLYFLSGHQNFGGTFVRVNDKYSYDPVSQTWTLLSSNTFSEFQSLNSFYVQSGKVKYLHYNQNVYIMYDDVTYEIHQDLTVNTYSYKLSFAYNNIVFGLANNTNFDDRLYNIITQEYHTIHNVSFLSDFFVVNDNIYFLRNASTQDYPSGTFNMKLRISELDVFF